MPTVPPVEPLDTLPVAPSPGVCGRLNGGEAAVVVAAIAAVTVLAVLQRPIPTALTVLTAAAVLLLLPGRVGRLLAALTGGHR
ncbi:hypothetical protein [Streptomyces sp. NEAU-YJ-81]|uniref:hypothetical protein n=1 Tax=Streptomyces sp. NEAU-YJ-81 TaxID=2820288 RepID=UPI001ABD0D77|nr:hypothetical protein [Streptomyces sp. NEAU-YJ-81]MBO3681697.1 hypothetical protein [Streptomyces sp. NEAU-YJ-81]